MIKDMNASYLCDVVVLTWNQLDIIREFVKSFLSNTTLPSRLIIVDNGSTDGTKEYLLSLNDTSNCKFKIVLNEENKGFVGGMNQGIEISSAPYVCLANNDLLFTKGWLKEVISIFQKYPNVGVLNPNSSSLGRTPLGKTSLEDFAAQLKDKQKGLFVETPFCIGFCMIIKREVINKVGALSEEFYPIFFEDSDYSMKALKAGYLIGVARGSYVWHKEHASFKQMNRNKEKFFVKNRSVFQKKWGKILRIAYIMNDGKELSAELDKGINLARDCNYIYFFIKNLDKERAAIFKEHGVFFHSGVSFVKFGNIFDLVWKILRKKKGKKYDLIVSKDKFLQRIFSRLGIKILSGLNKAEIRTMKMGLLQR